MATIAVTRVAGLHTNANELASPEGALLKADNCVIRANNVIEPRRGQELVEHSWADPAQDIIFFGGEYFVNDGNGLYMGSGADPKGLGEFGRWAMAQQCLFFCADAGVYVLETTAGTLSAVGLPRPPDVTVISLTTGGAGSWSWANRLESKVAYRVVWGRKDAHGRTILSPPSGRALIGYESATANDYSVSMRVPAMPGATSSHFFQVYRSESTPNGDVEASDDLYLVHEGQAANVLTIPAGGILKANGLDIAVVTSTAHGYASGQLIRVSPGEAEYPAIETAVTVIDANSFQYQDGVPGSGAASTLQQTITPYAYEVADYTPDALLSVPLYTNPTDGEGILQSNEPPPACTDIAHWSDRLWFSNTTHRARLEMALLGVGTGGIQNNDTITIGGRTYTGHTSGSYTAAAEEFLITVVASGPPAVSAAQALQATTMALVRAINQNPNNTTVTAYYDSAETDAPGRFTLEARTVGASFTVYATRASSTGKLPFWNPILGQSLGTATTVEPEETINRLHYSKPQQPEAVPLLNYLDVGAENYAIAAICPQKDRLLVFKDDGIFAVSGTYPFRVDLIDDTLRVIATRSIKSLGNQVYCLTNQGVVSISEAGVGVVSRPIENELLPKVFNPIDIPAEQVEAYSFAVAYETERQYILFLASESPDEHAHEAYVYNYMNNAWTHWLLNRTCGAIDPVEDLLWMGGTVGGALYSERKQYESSDHHDETLSIGVDSVSGFALTLADASGVAVGDQLAITPGDFEGIVSEVAGNVVTVAPATGAGAPGVGTAIVHKAFPCVVQWAAQDGEAPSMNKHYRSAQILFGRRNFYSGSATFATETSQTSQSVALVFSDRTSSQEVDLTERPFPQNKRVLIPKEKQIATFIRVGFSITEGDAAWSLNGYALDFEPVSERSNR